MGIGFQLYLSASPYESYIKRDKDGYKVNPGDTIEIRVLNENECSINTKINPNGHIRLVYIGMIEVTGLSVSQIEAKIRNEYINQKIFRNPTVIVEITSYSPNMFTSQVPLINLVHLLYPTKQCNKYNRVN